MKTFDKKDVFTCANEENASSYIMKQGYFADDIKELREAIVSKPLSHLIGIELDATYPFASNLGEKGTYRLFIPADKVKEVEEKKWRPFNCIEEVFVTLNKDIGSLITYRTKDFPLRTITTTIIGYAKEKNKEDQIQIGTGMIELSNCFEGIEIWNKNQWQPFGVEE